MCTYIGHHFWWESQNFADGEVEQRNDSLDGDSSWLVHVDLAVIFSNWWIVFYQPSRPRVSNKTIVFQLGLTLLTWMFWLWWRFFSLRLCTLGLFVRPQHIAGGFTGSFTLTSFGWNLVAENGAKIKIWLCKLKMFSSQRSEIHINVLAKQQIALKSPVKE